MTITTFRRWTAVIAVVLVVVIAVSIIANYFIIPLVTVVLAIVAIYILRKRVKEVTKDERTVLLHQKAAEATISFCVPVIALSGLILFALREHLSPELTAAGYVLAYVACALLVIHSAFYSFYARKH